MKKLHVKARCIRLGRGSLLVLGLVAAAAAAPALSSIRLAAQTLSPKIPVYQVDPSWPKPLPNGWGIGPVSGISADSRDHVWIVHRQETVKQAGGTPAPPVIEFDAQGTVVQTWGGPGAGYEWPEQLHGINVDGQNRVWVTGNGADDAQILVFTIDGTFIRQIGHSGKMSGSNDTANLGHATQARFDAASGSVFVSDGESSQNHRVIVFDAATGAYQRHWGAYGKRPNDAEVVARFDPAVPPPAQFGTVHCLRIARDGRVYVCDRGNNRFQVFQKDGTFLKEQFIAKDDTKGAGSVWDIEFSLDAPQRFMFIADGTNEKVWILDRESLNVVGSFGSSGKAPGQFATPVHDLTMDSKGNLYTGEAATAGRVQKFSLKE
jgi:DNA-binding beta-propeller fold protein YncE